MKNKLDGRTRISKEAGNDFFVYEDVRNKGKTVFYVGKGRGKRVFKQSLRKNNQWLNIVKREKGFLRRVVASGLTNEQACLEEIKRIKIYGRKNLVNQTSGGDGGLGNTNGRVHKGRILSKEWRGKISKGLKGKRLGVPGAKWNTKERFEKHRLRMKKYWGVPENREKLKDRMKGNKNLLGHKHSEETKKKIGIKSLGNKFNLGRKASRRIKEKMRSTHRELSIERFLESLSHSLCAI